MAKNRRVVLLVYVALAAVLGGWTFVGSAQASTFYPSCAAKYQLSMRLKPPPDPCLVNSCQCTTNSAGAAVCSQFCADVIVSGSYHGCTCLNETSYICTSPTASCVTKRGATPSCSTP